MKRTIAQPIPVLALPLVSTPLGLVFVGTVVVGGVIWYIYQDQHHRKFRSRVRYGAHAHNQSNNQYEEEFSTSESATRCHELAEEKTRETGRKWRVKVHKPVRGTGLMHTKKKITWECLITDAPQGEE
ncbi:MAG: hypothetical protein DSM106950_38355 [Stigonema ocellatum SAG 48.90 = DSM 106950]|nr:hypothetical protein [Stigonema ocellatum SAG 48.90 = DSM 106950]